MNYELLQRLWTIGEPVPILRAVDRDRPKPAVQADPRLALIRDCPHRGPTLPHTLQPECGCSELSECRAGNGRRPGAVSLRECLDCPTIATG